MILSDKNIKINADERMQEMVNAMAEYDQVIPASAQT